MLERVAVAIVRSDPPRVYIADSDETLGRVLALQVVAQSDPQILRRAGVLREIREALLEERWADAVSAWIEASDEEVDGYPDELVWSARSMDAEATSLEIRLAPIFRDV